MDGAARRIHVCARGSGISVGSRSTNPPGIFEGGSLRRRCRRLFVVVESLAALVAACFVFVVGVRVVGLPERQRGVCRGGGESMSTSPLPLNRSSADSRSMGGPRRGGAASAAAGVPVAEASTDEANGAALPARVGGHGRTERGADGQDRGDSTRAATAIVFNSVLTCACSLREPDDKGS